jgi:hypothetical protein
MLNKLIFLVFVTLGLTVIVLCIMKSTKIEEHYIMNSEYSDVILPCENNELVNSYDVIDVLKILKKYNVEKEDLILIKNKLLEKGSNKKICRRALLLILDTYLIYYKPIIDLVIKELNNNQDSLEEEIEENNIKKDVEDKELDFKIYDDINLDEIDNKKNNNKNCKNIKNFVTKLEVDGFITRKNKEEIIRHYNYKC